MQERKIQDTFTLITLMFLAALFFTLAMSNICDILVKIQFLPQTIVFRSGNLFLLKETIAIYGGGESLAIGLLTFFSFWQLLVSDAFIMAVITFILKKPTANLWMTIGSVLSITLWMVMFLGAEIFVAYQHNLKFIALMILQLLLWQRLSRD